MLIEADSVTELSAQPLGFREDPDDYEHAACSSGVPAIMKIFELSAFSGQIWPIENNSAGIQEQYKKQFQVSRGQTLITYGLLLCLEWCG